MNDQELVELAARAAGIKTVCAAPFGGVVIGGNGGDLVEWRPVTDDGDALRLAVQLDIDVFQSTAHKEAQAGGAIPSTIFEPWGDDKLAATRRAIVRAAAEIGRAMGN